MSFISKEEFIRVSRGRAVTRPKQKISTGYAKCSFCNYVVPKGEFFWVQRERADGFDYDGINRACIQHQHELIDPELSVDILTLS